MHSQCIHPHETSPLAGAAALEKALAIVRTDRACGLRLPQDARVALALAVVGFEVMLDHDAGLAHVKLGAATDRGPR